MEQGARVYLVTKGIYSDERSAGVYPSLDRAKGQFPDATWTALDDDDSILTAELVVVGHWPSGRPILDAATIYEMSFDQDIK